MLNIINFLGYPAVLDGEQKHEFSVKVVWTLLWKAFKQIAGQPSLRRLLGEAVGFETGFKASKDYLQPILKQTAIALPLLLALDQQKRVALLIGVVYFVLYLLSSVASRQAHRLVDWRGGEVSATRFMWRINGLLFVCLVPLLWFKQYAFVIVAFILLTALQDLWRPVLVSRINASSSPEMGATILSIESQAKSGATILLAPLLGFVVDRIDAFWPVGIVGAVIATVFILSSHRKRFAHKIDL